MKYLYTLLSLFSITLATAHKPDKVMNGLNGWHVLGGNTVDYSCGRGQINVLGSTRFDWIKFKSDASLNITDVEIYFNNDETQTVSLIPEKKSVAESKPVLVSPGDHYIKKIVFLYKASEKKSFDKAHIEVWGYVPEIAKL